MRRTRQGNNKTSDGRPNDGADLPLLHPRLLGQLVNPSEGRRSYSAEGDCLILSDDELELFDTNRVDEVRHALSAEHAFSEWHGGAGIERRRPRWRKAMWAAVFVVLAVAAGVTIGVVL